MKSMLCISFLFFAGIGINASVAADQPSPIHQWSFDAQAVQGTQVNAAQGNLPGKANARVIIRKHGEIPAMQMDGKTSILIAADATKIAWPKKTISLEGWVRVDAQAKLPDWGGFISALQDNGDYERGILLGFHKNQFCLAITSEKTKRLTYLNCRTPFEYDRWYHLVGTYDGKEMRVYVDGKLENSSLAQQGDILYPPKFVYELGAYHDDNEHYRHAGWLHELSVFDQAISEKMVVDRFNAKRKLFPTPAELIDGPYVEMVDRTTVKIKYVTDLDCPTVIELGPKGEKSQVLAGKVAMCDHTRTVLNIEPDREYEFRVHLQGDDGSISMTETFKFDSTFVYTLPPKPKIDSPFVKNEWSDAISSYAARALKESDSEKGYCLIVGCGDGRLAYEIAMRSGMQVVAVDDDEANVAEARTLLDEAGLYGVRVSVHHGKLDDLPYGPYFANLILSQTCLMTGKAPAGATELKRVLQPAGGVLMLGSTTTDSSAKAPLTAWAKPLGDAKTENVDGSTFVTYTRPKLENSGVWTHQYGEADNSSNSKDELIKGPMEVLWWGKPGPRPMPDRGARNPAPLSANGVLYVQGDRVLFGIDAYNGTILWSYQLPMMRRTNIPRDSSNMVANDEGVFIAIGSDVVGFHGRTGERLCKLNVPVEKEKEEDEGKYDWGYLAAIGNQIIGSANHKRAGYRGDVGEWYEDFKPGQIDRVTSSHLFSIDSSENRPQWNYRNGVILNSTITISNGKIFFVESRNPAAKAKAGSRLVEEIKKDQFIVAIDLKTGDKVWDKAVDLTKCEYMVYLSYANHTLLVTGTDRNKTYHMYAFDSGGGTELWQRHDKAKKNHHSGQLQHPAHIRDKIYVNQHVISLREGKSLRSNIAERRGCGTMSASNGSLFYRHYFQGMWDLESDKRSEFQGIRSGCWLGIIPAGGIVLAPETSSGCSCTHAIQTSIAYVPINRLGRKAESEMSGSEKAASDKHSPKDR